MFRSRPRRIRLSCVCCQAVLAVLLLAPAWNITSAQVIVFQPQVSQFRVNSSFFVPDGGTTYQGGMGRYGSGFQSAGIPMLGNVPGLGRLGRNQALGYSTSSTSVTTSVQVYNMRDIGEGILNGTHDQYGRPIVQPYPSAVPYASANQASANPEQPDTSRKDVVRTQTGGQSQSLPGRSPEQIRQRAMFLKANLGRPTKK